MPLALIRRLIKGSPLTATEHDSNLNVLEAGIAASLQPGQAIPSDVECRNNSGVGLTAGAPVYIVGSSGTKPTAALADASSETTAARSLGLVVATVTNNADCVVRTHGILTGIDTSALTEGLPFWLSEATGQLTSIRPTQPAHGVFLGFCVKQAAGTAGILYINVINGLELAELHDVLTTGATPGISVLRLAVDGLWKPATLGPGDVGADATGTASTAVSAHTSAADPHTQYLRIPEVIPGTNMAVDTTTTPGSVILNATASGSGFAGYQAGRWITPVPGNFATGSGLTANAIQALPFEVKRQIRVGGMGGRVTTGVAGSNIQFAVYDSTSAGIINNPIRNTASLGGGTAQFISDTAITSFLLLPDTLYWWATASDAGPVMQAVMNTNPNFTCLAGADSASASSSATATITAYSFAGTFGTWPNLSAASPTAVTNNRNAYPFLLISAFV